MEPFMSSCSSSSTRKRDLISFDEPSLCKRAKIDAFVKYSYECNGRVRPKNDVFLNYSYEDTGNGFVSHLKGGLERKGFTISDHTMLPIGKDESSELRKAVADSEISLVVFSINCSFSVRCLDELVYIMDCHSNPDFKIKRKVFPIFFNVDPSHVRSQQKGSFQKAFEAHERNFDPKRVHKWRQALSGAGHLSGLVVQNGVDEAELILRIVEELEQTQSPQELHVTDYPVGIESRVGELISKLRLDCKDPLILGVFGSSGSGKTTIVKSTYNRISLEFDVSCYLNIRDHCGIQNWKVDLQNKLISRLTQNHNHPHTLSHSEGVTKIRKLIRGRKILLVLDDVDNFQQLEALGIDSKWFDSGSRIIVNTRDKQSLGNIPYTSYNMKLLNRGESITLFTRLMLLRDNSVDTKFIKEVVSLAGGHPLVLKVWSCHFKQYEREQWSNILDTLKRIPHGDVQKQLQVSYDSLPDTSKKLFLDIACFFMWKEKDLVVKVLQDEGAAFYVDNEIQYLVHKSLLEVYHKVSMPHAIREMGREVVRQENQDDPGKRSRLMVHRDVVRVLRDCSGTESVEGIRLNSLDMKESVTVKVEAFKKMTNLRFIQLLDHNSQLQWSSSSRTDDMSSFSFQKLRYLEWERFPCKCIDIDMGNVVFIKLQNSNLELLWERVKSLKELRILDVSRSTALSKIGSFTGLEKLEQLCLSQCTSLKELDSSIGCLEKLVLLDLSFCTRLKRFPYEIIGNLRSLRGLNLCCCRHIGLKRDEIIDNFLSSLKECCLTWLDLGGCNILKISGEVGSLKSLKYLYLSRNSFPSLPDSRCQLRELNMIDLSSCTKLESIPNLPPNIKTIIADDCISLVNLPSNISDLQFLKDLKLDGCFKLEPEGFMKVARLRNLKTLRMRNCNVALVSSEIGNMVSLQYLDLSDNTFSSLPDSFSNLSELFELTMNDCSQLQFLPLLPSKLRNIEASGCSSLDVIPYDSMQKAYIFRSKVFKETFFTRELLINLSVEEVPDWCSYGNRGAVLSFVAPMHLDKKICGVVSFATIEFKDCDFDHCFSPTMINETKGTRHCFSKLQFKNRCMCVMFYPLNDKTVMLEAGDSIIFQFEDVNVSSCGLSLIYESDVVDDSTLAIQNVIKPIG